MVFNNKPLATIEERDLQRLIDNQVREGRAIDYKRTLPGGKDLEKKEFLADVSSFANASGGYLVFGMDEAEGVATGIKGLVDINVDREILRLDSILQSGLEPRIPSPEMHIVSLQDGGSVLLMSIRRSWQRPHRVSFQEWGRFFSRNAAGKFPLSVPELRDLFLRSETIGEHMRAFSRERLNLIIAGDTPVSMPEGAKLVVHLVPFAAFDVGASIDLAALEQDRRGLNPLGESGWNKRYNFDGFLTDYTYPHNGQARSYLQAFRNGCVEAVQGEQDWERDGQRHFGPEYLHEMLLTNLSRYIGILQGAGSECPFAVLISLLGMKGCVMKPRESVWRYSSYRESQPIDREVLILPEVIIDHSEADLASILRPVFDALWNAAGWRRCMYYDENGKWLSPSPR